MSSSYSRYRYKEENSYLVAFKYSSIFFSNGSSGMKHFHPNNNKADHLALKNLIAHSALLSRVELATGFFRARRHTIVVIQMEMLHILKNLDYIFNAV
ncbi:hypothetical protein L6452_04065 [Arctium lappa]|uniref:Uncharacterized protein n=1 Tax=Arctium lappa TaxID=4217 RepID=A0ACB9FQ65_ARCLA|nr:hypothetical protein L6452_04065 [Arctium lappa]